MDDMENVVEEKRLAKVVMEGLHLRWSLTQGLKKEGNNNKLTKGVLLEVEPSSIARCGPKESIKLSLSFGWMDEEVSATFQSVIGSMKWESWEGALMKWNMFLNLRARLAN